MENSVSDVFIFGSVEPPLNDIFDVHFRDFTIDATGRRVGKEWQGGHIFVLHGRMSFCSWVNVRANQDVPEFQIFRRVTTEGAGGFFDCLWQDCFLRHAPEATVPAFEVRGASQQFNANSLRDLRCHNSGTVPFFRFISGGQQRNNGNIMSRINFELCYGGMVHWESASNWLCEELVQYDIGSETTTGHGFYLGKAPDAGGTRHMTFVNCDRRTGTRGAGLYDVFLQPPSQGGTSRAEHIVLINCGATPQIESKRYLVNANDNPLTWIGMRNTDISVFTETQIENGAECVRIGNGSVRAKMIVQD